MKKILLTVAVVAAACLVSCSGSDSKDVKANESDIKAKIENCTNTDSLKVYVEQIKTYAEKLVSEGKVEEAKKYLGELRPVVEKYAPSLAGTFTSVQTALDKLPTSPVDSIKSAGNEAVDSLKSKTSQAVNAAGDVVENGKEAVKAAADEAKEKATEAVDATKEKAAEVANAAKDKAAEATQAAADKINGMLKK